MHCDAHRHLGRHILYCLPVRHVPGGLLAPPSTAPPARPAIDHRAADINLRIIAPPDPLPPRPRPHERRLHQVLGQRPVARQQPRRPLQRALARLDELREPLSLGVHKPVGQLDASTDTTTWLPSEVYPHRVPNARAGTASASLAGHRHAGSGFGA